MDRDNLMHYDLMARLYRLIQICFDYALLCLTILTTLRNSMSEKKLKSMQLKH